MLAFPRVAYEAALRDALEPAAIWSLVAFIKSIESIEDVYSPAPPG